MMNLRSVIVTNLDALGVAVLPHEADAPLVVDADAVLPAAIARQRFQPVRRRNAQIIKTLCGIQHPQLAPRDDLDLVGQLPAEQTRPDALRRFVVEGNNHYWIVSHGDNIVNR